MNALSVRRGRPKDITACATGFASARPNVSQTGTGKASGTRRAALLDKPAGHAACKAVARQETAGINPAARYWLSPGGRGDLEIAVNFLPEGEGTFRSATGGW